MPRQVSIDHERLIPIRLYRNHSSLYELRLNERGVPGASLCQ